MDPETVKSDLKSYFESRGLEILSEEYSVFNHPIDDVHERSFIIDLAIGPEGTKGIRTDEQIKNDKERFESSIETIDDVINGLRNISVFPGNPSREESFVPKANSNPVVGIAVEIENNVESKYFLGSFMAAAVSGRWGIMIVKDDVVVDRWVETLIRIIRKGTNVAVPGNGIIIKHSRLLEKIKSEPSH